MGVANTKIMDNDLPIEVIIKRMDECVLPDEREIVLDYMEMLEGTCYYSPFSLNFFSLDPQYHVTSSHHIMLHSSYHIISYHIISYYCR